MTDKLILDACCGSRMFWWNKRHPAVIYNDNRKLEATLCDGRKLVIDPDTLCDFRDLPFPDKYFKMVIFDPHTCYMQGKALGLWQNTDYWKRTGRRSLNKASTNVCAS